MTEAMVRFNLVGGLVYALTGDEAGEALREWAGQTSEVYIIHHDGKKVAIYNNHILSVEWKGME